MGSKLEDNTLTLYLEGRLGVENAQTVQDELMDAVAANPGANVVLDAGDLECIASSGLRVLPCCLGGCPVHRLETGEAECPSALFDPDVCHRPLSQGVRAVTLHLA